MDTGIGEIRVVRAFKYHGKTYAFYSGDTVHSAIIGSANLGAIKLEDNNRRQYEISVLTTDPHEAGEIALHISQLSSNACSINIADAYWNSVSPIEIGTTLNINHPNVKMMLQKIKEFVENFGN